MFLKKTVPFLITFIMGIITFLCFFVPHHLMQSLWDGIANWALIISGGAIAVGAWSMIRNYSKKAMSKNDPNRMYSAITMLSLIAMTVIGFTGGVKAGTLFNDVYNYVLSPLNSTMFALLAFYIASAAFRSFRLKSFHAGLLLGAALIVMLAQIPTGAALYSDLPAIKDWILRYPNVAGQRAIMIGVATGSVATALKIILGIDKSIFTGSGK